MESFKTDILIVGAGVIGSSVAMHLSEKLGAAGSAGDNNNFGVLAVDFDLEGSLSSSELNAGGVRAIWVNACNILSSKTSIEYFSKNAEDVGYRDCGYLWLYRGEQTAIADKAQILQQDLGWEVQNWSTKELTENIPFIDKTDSISKITFSPRDGLVNPNRLKNHYREKAAQNGSKFWDRIWIDSVEQNSKGFLVKARQFINKPIDIDMKEKVLTQQAHDLKALDIEIQCSRLVNCAGAWAGQLAEHCGYQIGSKPYRRQLCIFDAQKVDLTPYGMIVDTSGVYFHPEATNGLAGYADPSEAPGYRFNYDEDAFFMEKIWPALYERSSHFEALKHITGWSGLYAESLDHSAIIGESPSHSRAFPGRLYEAHSYSGHGVMHSYSSVLGIAELMLNGKYQTLDLSAFSGSRFDEGKLIEERLVI